MNDNIFRKQSLDRISSPEQLTDYIKVSSPRVWVILFAIAILLISCLIWSVFGTLSTTQKTSAYVHDGNAVCYVDKETAAKLKPGMSVQLGKASGIIVEIAGEQISEEELNEKVLNSYTVKTLMSEHRIYPVNINVTGVPDGIYEIVITTDSVKPISFILN